MKTIHQSILATSFLLLLFLPNTSAQDAANLNLPEGAKLRLGKGTLGEVAYFPDCTRFAVASSIGIWIYDSITGNELHQLTDVTNQVHGINNISFAPDGKTIATGGLNGTILLWDAEGHHLISFTDDEITHYDPVFSPNGKIIATTCAGKYSFYRTTIRLYDVRTGELLRTFTDLTNRFYNIRFSPDSRTLATWKNNNRTVKLWDVVTGNNIKTFNAHERSVNSLWFSPDGKVIATSGEDDMVCLWDANTGELIRAFYDQHINDFNSVCFSPDGKLITTEYTSDDIVNLWNTNSGDKLNSLIPKNPGGVNSISISPNGRITAIGLSDGSIHLWATKIGLHLISLTGNKGLVNFTQ